MPDGYRGGETHTVDIYGDPLCISLQATEDIGDEGGLARPWGTGDVERRDIGCGRVSLEEPSA